jgi:intergrase/recombinase
MKALAALSKFLGKYDEWLKIIKKFQLKWSSGNNSIKAFKSIFDFENQGNNLYIMLKWVREVRNILPKDYENITLFNALTGLRPEEAQRAIWLIKNKENEYIDRDRGLAKHYLYPEVFLRQTKNAYISIINEEILKIARETTNKEHYHSSLRKRISITNSFEMNMYYCRKVFATYLRNKGMEPEIIDLLQGRTSSSVFVNHYYRLDINEIITKRIRPH